MSTWTTRRAAGLAILLLLPGMTGHGGIAAADLVPPESRIVTSVRVAAIRQAMSGTRHDFSPRLLDDTGDDFCRVCHVFEDTGDGQSVRFISDAPTGGVYSTYTGYDLEHLPLQPYGVSRFCLGCHDGTIALDAYGVRMGRIDSRASLGTSLKDDHPVSIRYDDSDREIRPARTPLFFGDGSAGSIADLLENGEVQCNSCHDIHNVRGAGAGYLLVLGNTRSALCMTCHVR